MKNKTLISLLLITQILTNSLSAQITTKSQLSGSWLGKIQAGAVQLRVIFNLSLVEKDSLIATLDSPDQGAKNIKLGKVTFTGETLKILAPALAGEYNGVLKSDSLF
jgi:hypothetical protein